MSGQRVLTIETLAESGIEAGADFTRHHLPRARELLEDDDMDALAIVLPVAGPDHRDWRRALARDLARAHTPKRVNVAAGSPGAALDTLLDYLGDAPGVTGHYLEAHE